jgi:phosphatidate cytidylyltransferase
VLTRLIGSAIVVVVGVVTILIGGPIYALALFALCAAGYHEYLGLASPTVSGGSVRRIGMVGYAIIAALGGAAFAGAGEIALFAIAALAIALPLALTLPWSAAPGAVACWALAAAGSLYLGLPAFAAIELRSLTGDVSSGWLTRVTNDFALGWEPMPRGAAWVLTVVVTTWAGDTCAYLTGRSLGTHMLAPLLSPNKTIEGAVGGLLGAIVVSWLTVTQFGLASSWTGLLLGALLGIAGQAGDLSESLLKRQAGVKDSGSVIPGHGGLLDRIDALLFTFPTGFVLATAIERLGR